MKDNGFLVTTKDVDGNSVPNYPITKISKVIGLEEELTQVQTDLEETTTRLKEFVQGVQSDLENLALTKASAEDVDSLRTRMDANFDSIGFNLSSIKESVTELEAKISEVDSDLKNRILEVIGTTNELLDALQEVQADFTTIAEGLEDRINSLASGKADHETVQAYKDSFERTLDDMQDQLDNWSSSIQGIETQVQTNRSDISDLKADVENAQDTISDLEEKVSTHETIVQATQEAVLGLVTDKLDKETFDEFEDSYHNTMQTVNGNIFYCVENVNNLLTDTENIKNRVRGAEEVILDHTERITQLENASGVGEFKNLWLVRSGLEDVSFLYPDESTSTFITPADGRYHLTIYNTAINLMIEMGYIDGLANVDSNFEGEVEIKEGTFNFVGNNINTTDNTRLRYNCYLYGMSAETGFPETSVFTLLNNTINNAVTVLVIDGVLEFGTTLIETGGYRQFSIITTTSFLNYVDNEVETIEIDTDSEGHGYVVYSSISSYVVVYAKDTEGKDILIMLNASAEFEIEDIEVYPLAGGTASNGSNGIFGNDIDIDETSEKNVIVGSSHELLENVSESLIVGLASSFQRIQYSTFFGGSLTGTDLVNCHLAGEHITLLDSYFTNVWGYQIHGENVGHSLVTGKALMLTGDVENSFIHALSSEFIHLNDCYVQGSNHNINTATNSFFRGVGFEGSNLNEIIIDGFYPDITQEIRSDAIYVFGGGNAWEPKNLLTLNKWGRLTVQELKTGIVFADEVYTNASNGASVSVLDYVDSLVTDKINNANAKINLITDVAGQVDCDELIPSLGDKADIVVKSPYAGIFTNYFKGQYFMSAVYVGTVTNIGAGNYLVNLSGIPENTTQTGGQWQEERVTFVTTSDLVQIRSALA